MKIFKHLNVSIGFNDDTTSDEVLNKLKTIERMVEDKYKGEFSLTFTDNFIPTRIELNRLLNKKK